MAQEYEKRAASLPDLSPPLVPSGAMAERPAPKEIELRAYHLWEQAGRPEGKDQEFYQEAERLLQEELVKEKLGDESAKLVFAHAVECRPLWLTRNV